MDHTHDNNSELGDTQNHLHHLDMVEHIYESSLLMGLTNLQDKDSSIKTIRAALGEELSTQ